MNMVAACSTLCDRLGLASLVMVTPVCFKQLNGGITPLGRRLGFTFRHVEYSGTALAGDDLVAFLHIYLDLRTQMHVASTAGSADHLCHCDSVPASLSKAVIDRCETGR